MYAETSSSCGNEDLAVDCVCDHDSGVYLSVRIATGNPPDTPK